MMSTPEQRHPSFGSPRLELELDGQIIIVWPEPKPAWFQISSDLFEHIVDELNAGRHLADTLELAQRMADLIGAIDGYRHASDETDDASARAHA